MKMNVFQSHAPRCQVDIWKYISKNVGHFDYGYQNQQMHLHPFLAREEYVLLMLWVSITINKWIRLLSHYIFTSCSSFDE